MIAIKYPRGLDIQDILRDTINNPDVKDILRAATLEVRLNRLLRPFSGFILYVGDIFKKVQTDKFKESFNELVWMISLALLVDTIVVLLMVVH